MTSFALYLCIIPNNFPCDVSTTRKKDHCLVSNSAKVLVIDDSTTFCLIMASALEKAGYQVMTASNGNEGLAKALQEGPHCVIIDVVLPGISGFGLCRQLRSLDPQRNLSIIMVSTKNTNLDQSWGLLILLKYRNKLLMRLLTASNLSFCQN